MAGHAPGPRRGHAGTRRGDARGTRDAGLLLRGPDVPRRRAGPPPANGRDRRPRPAQPQRPDAPGRPPRGARLRHSLRGDRGRPRSVRRAHRRGPREGPGGPPDAPRGRPAVLPRAAQRQRPAGARRYLDALSRRRPAVSLTASAARIATTTVSAISDGALLVTSTASAMAATAIAVTRLASIPV